MPEYANVTLESANAPESRKRGLEQDRRKRAAMYVRHLNACGIDIAVNQESGTYLEAEVERHPRLRTHYAPPNDKVKEREVGNGQVSRAAINLDHARRISVQRTGRGGLLHQSVCLYHVPAAEGVAEVVVIGIHAQTRSADPFGRSRKRLNQALVAYSEQLAAEGILHIIAGDANNGKPSWARQFPNLKVAAHHGVDWVLVSPTIKVRGSRTHRLPRISDHAFISADLAIPVSDTTNKRLPAVKE